MSFYLLHRGWMDNEIFGDEAFTDRLAWVWLIQEASYEPHKIRYKNKMIEVGIGQVPISYRRLVDKWKWGIHRIRNFLSLLESEQMITRQTTTPFLVITICNYEKYQKPTKISTTQTTTQTATLPTTQTTTNNKKIKNLKKEYTPDFEAFWNEHPGKHGSKEKAFESYLKALEEVPHEALIGAARKYFTFVRDCNAEQRHIAHAATWINQKRWEAEYTAQEPKIIINKDREARTGARTLV